MFHNTIDYLCLSHWGSMMNDGTTARQFLTDDIIAMMNWESKPNIDKRMEFLESLSSNGLLSLWQDLAVLNSEGFIENDI